MSYSNPRCYAHPLGGCSKKISNEHYFSHSLLKMLAKDELLHVEGLPWIQVGSNKKIPPTRLAAKILCENHNSRLSIYDDIAKTVFNHLRYESSFEDPLNVPKEFEYWYLKLLIGALVANKTSSGVIWKPPLEWLEILFESRELEPGIGLYIPSSGKTYRGVYNGADISLIYIDPDRYFPCAVLLRFGWFVSYFTMASRVFPTENTFVYHPISVSVRYPDKVKYLFFPWTGSLVGFNGPIPNDPTQ